VYTGVLADPILESHVAELGAAYQVFHRVAPPDLRREAALLVDFLQNEQIAIPAHLGDPEDALPCLRAAVERAHPDRKCIGFLLAGFPGWVNAVAPPSRQAFLDAFPELASEVLDLGDAGMKQVVDIVSSQPAAMKPIAAYSMTTAEVIRSVVRIAHAVVTYQRMDLMDALVEAVPPARLRGEDEDEGWQRDSGRLLDAIAASRDAAGDAWPAAMELGLVLARLNVSSAYAAMSALPGAIAKTLSPGVYLNDFRALVGAIGLRSVGTCLNALPTWYSKAGGEVTRRFVNLACEAGRGYGVVAGMAFLERRTPSSRRLLP